MLFLKEDRRSRQYRIVGDVVGRELRDILNDMLIRLGDAYNIIALAIIEGDIDPERIDRIRKNLHDLSNLLRQLERQVKVRRR